MIEEFKTVTEIYKRVMPALKTKRNELKRKHLGSISENMIWNYLRESKWGKGKVTNLTLYDIVDDILKLDEKELIIYYNEMERRKKHD